jgi:adenylate kinase family enzyme
VNTIRAVLREAFGIQETILDKNVLKAIMMAGGPGSGKSYVLSKLRSDIHPMPKVIDSDKIFEAKLKSRNLPFKLAIPNSIEREKQMATRNEAMDVNVKVLHQQLNGFMPIIIDGTGKNFDKYIKQKEALESLGYDVMCLMINTSLAVAQERNANRIRSLTEPEVENFWLMCQTNFTKYSSIFTYSYVANNDPGMLNESELIRTIKKFLTSPVQNPIGQELFNAKVTGSINRQVAPTAIQPFT